MTSSITRRLVRAVAPRRTLSRALTMLAVVGLATTSCDVHGISKPGTLSNIIVSPNPQIIVAGATQQFTATGTDFAGVNAVFTPAWTAEAGGGTINSTGLFTAGTVTGTFTNTVMAASGGKSSMATVVVVAGPLATITITPSPTTMMIGTGQQFVAVGTDEWGNMVTFTPTWSVVAGGGAINSTGMFTAGSVSGTFAGTVQASSLGVKGLATVTVTPGPLATIVVTPNPITLAVGVAQQFTAVGRDASGNAVAIAPVWSLSAGGGAIGATGLFTAGPTPGTYTNTVTATSGGLSGRATVVVTPGPVATITVSPNPTSLIINTTGQFTAVGRDVGGNIVPITPAWAVVAGGGSIDLSSGLFTAGGVVGTFPNTVRASVGQVAGSATVSVTGGALTTIVVTPNPVSMQVGAAQQFTAVGFDAGGNSFPITPVWSTGGGGTITAGGVFTAGLVTGVFPGAVRATSGTVTGAATVTVTAIPPSLTTIIVNPNPAFVSPNGTQQFTALGSDANGNPFAFTPTWAVINGGGIINPTTGVFTAGAATGTFINTIRATGAGGATGLATVNVTAAAPVLTTITVAPNPASMLTGGSQPFTAIGRDQNGIVMVITPAWSVINGGGIITPATGVFTSNGTAGTFLNTVQAAVGLVTGTATVIATAVAPAPLIDLGIAAGNGIMAGTAVTCVSLGIINADVSIAPGNTLTGFPPCTITGVRNLGTPPAPAQQVALTGAYNQLFGLQCLPQNFISANLGGTTKAAGVYCSATSIGVTGTLTLDGGGDPNATFVFQAGTGLTTAGNVVLINGAQAKNVWWGVGSSATIGTASQWQGNIIALTSITLVDNATLTGRALARNGAVTLGTGNVIILP